ncbi:MAG: hypothetical protein Q9173_000240 [Seirophora scorigena]
MRRKRQPSEAGPEIDSRSLLTVKQQKLEHHQRHSTPSCFWDNLSQQRLTRRTLREFDRRTVQPAAITPYFLIDNKDISLAKLKRFARQGGPSLTDVRGYPKPKVSVPSSPIMRQSGSRKRAKTGKDSDASSSTRKSSAYDPAFRQHLVDYRIYRSGRAQKPSNWNEIHNRLAQSRSSLSPSRFSEAAFEAFQETNENALTENKVMSKAFPFIAGSTNNPSQENLYFSNLEDLTDGSITKAKPDLYDGASPADLDTQIRERLSKYIEPSSNKSAPLLPNFFVEGKGHDGRASVNELQALYDGALGERGMLKLSSYIEPQSMQYNVAHTITSTYHGGTGDLTIYSAHAVESSSTQRPTEFRITQLNGWKMTGNPDAFRQGAIALRNARDWAKEKREELIFAANSNIRSSEDLAFNSSMQSPVSVLSRELTQPESETSADELSVPVATRLNTNQKASDRLPKVS